MAWNELSMHSCRHLIVLMLVILLLSACAGMEQKNGPASSIKDEAGVAQIEKDLEEGNTDLAILQLQPLIKENPDSAHLHALAGQAYARSGDVPNAEEHYKRALKLTPNDPVLLMNYGVFLCHQEKYADADNAFVKAIRVPERPYRDIALVNAGICARKAGGLQRAERYFNAALEVNPNSAVALYQLARLSMEVDRPAQARVFMIRYDAIAEPMPKSLLLSALIGDELGDYNLASMSSDKLLELYPDSPEAASLTAGTGRKYMGLPVAGSSPVSSAAPIANDVALNSMLSPQDDTVEATGQKQSPPPEQRLAQPASSEGAEPDATDGLPGIQWIMAQPGTNYTLQLSASSNRDNLITLQHRLKLEEYGIFSFVREGKVIYVLISGSYPDYQEAVHSGEPLVNLGYQEKPWARTFASVHQLIQGGQ